MIIPAAAAPLCEPPRWSLGPRSGSGTASPPPAPPATETVPPKLYTHTYQSRDRDRGATRHCSQKNRRRRRWRRRHDVTRQNRNGCLCWRSGSHKLCRWAHGTNTCRSVMCQACRSYRLHDTGQAVRVGGTYVTCRHLVCAGSLAERGLTPSGRGTSAGADIAVTAISVPAVTDRLNQTQAVGHSICGLCVPRSRLGRSGPNLKPGTVRVCGMRGLRKGMNTAQHPPSPASRAWTDPPTNVQAVSRAVRYVNTHRLRFQIRARSYYTRLSQFASILSVCVLCGSPVWPSPPVVGPLWGPPLCVGPLRVPSVWVPCGSPLCGSPDALRHDPCCTTRLLLASALAPA